MASIGKVEQSDAEKLTRGCWWDFVTVQLGGLELAGLLALLYWMASSADLGWWGRWVLSASFDDVSNTAVLGVTVSAMTVGLALLSQIFAVRFNLVNGDVTGRDVGRLRYLRHGSYAIGIVIAAVGILTVAASVAAGKQAVPATIVLGICCITVFVVVNGVRGVEALPGEALASLRAERTSRLQSASKTWSIALSGSKWLSLGASILVVALVMYVIALPILWGSSQGLVWAGYAAVALLLAGMGAGLAIAVGSLVGIRSPGAAITIDAVWVSATAALLAATSTITGAGGLARGAVLCLSVAVCVGVFLWQLVGTEFGKAHPRCSPVRAFVAASLEKEAHRADRRGRSRGPIGRWYADHSGHDPVRRD